MALESARAFESLRKQVATPAEAVALFAEMSLRRQPSVRIAIILPLATARHRR